MDTIPQQLAPVPETPIEHPVEKTESHWENPIPSKYRKPALVGGICVFLIFLSLVYMSTKRPAPTPVKPMPITPSTSPTQNPAYLRKTYPIATTAAFLELESSITNLSASISALQTQDPSLFPPVLDLPLGYTR